MDCWDVYRLAIGAPLPAAPAGAGTTASVGAVGTSSDSVEASVWLQPDSSNRNAPRWGHPDGIQVGIEPGLGPRGLLRVFAPYLGSARLLNFVAVEPVAAGATDRGYSELEHSALDNRPGKRFWASQDPSNGSPRPTDEPVPGVVTHEGGVERLTVHVHSERFDNGAEVVVRVQFRADRPREVSLAALRRPGSAELTACVLSATMGNYARLRRLHLADGVVTPAELWPGFTGTEFTPHARFGLDRLHRDGAAALVWATPDEQRPWSAVHAAGTAAHWRYEGARAVQGWRIEEPSDSAAAQVNARWAYWASASPIPGGPAYENLEVVDGFRDGQELVYWCEPCADDEELAAAVRRHGAGA